MQIKISVKRQIRIRKKIFRIRQNAENTDGLDSNFEDIKNPFMILSIIVFEFQLLEFL
jgi:hypothetical protein